jgi:hypothetical protein
MNAPRLLINDYGSVDNLVERICNNRVCPLDTEMPTCRFRGTVVKKNDAGSVAVTGWQRNYARLRKMDVSLPTIISVDLKYDPFGNNYVISNATLDRGFKGSKGILCSASYLDRNVRKVLVGKTFDRNLQKSMKLESLHCFHLVEVITGMVSYFSAIDEEVIAADAGALLYEEEAGDYWSEDGSTAYGSGVHRMKGKEPVHFQLTFPELFSRIRFGKNGDINCSSTLDSQFSVNRKFVREDQITLGSDGINNVKLARMLLGCVRSVQKALDINLKEPMRCCNLYPSAFLGVFTQALAIRHFSQNYQYIMHALTALQRRNGIPLCIGASSDSREMKQYFPDFSPADL